MIRIKELNGEMEKLMHRRDEIEEEIKEKIIDDLETIEEEIQSEQPKGIRIKKAYQRIKLFRLRRWL